MNLGEKVDIVEVVWIIECVVIDDVVVLIRMGYEYFFVKDMFDWCDMISEGLNSLDFSIIEIVSFYDLVIVVWFL